MGMHHPASTISGIAQGVIAFQQQRRVLQVVHDNARALAEDEAIEAINRLAHSLAVERARSADLARRLAQAEARAAHAEGLVLDLARQ